MSMSPPPRNWVPPEDNRRNKEPSEQTVLEMKRGAEAIGRYIRRAAIRTWAHEGKLKWHASTIEDPTGPVNTVIVGDETFSEPSIEFPSEELFARIGLAVNFGGTVTNE